MRNGLQPSVVATPRFFIARFDTASYTFGGANIPWGNGAIRAAQPVLVKSAEAGFAAVEMQMFKNAGYSLVGQLLLPPF
ncbi:MAG TPA: hypothetical protein VK868_16760 [Pyrinomonadaceae bacterium]|nr:hypothetical protein [Pyrinomonadaceae bacterium]